ncbi:MAG: cytochrome c oxidase subunit [Thermoleophilaceae bacterium]|jgi:cytochrome c oxidase subunit 2|nr:cytochrome c oxidase subunit [Thermoleophilaceae bacterium]
MAALFAAFALVALAVAGPAFAGVISPESGGSPNADDISSLYEITLYIAIVIFVGVEGTLLWSLFRYRARKGGTEPAQVRGNTPLEVGWTVGAALILVLLTVVTFVYIGDIQNPPATGPGGFEASTGVKFASVSQVPPPGGKALHINVNGQQYLWRYDYEGYGDNQLFSYYDMVVPVNTTVTLSITSSDVAHSWWIPTLGGKADAIPGHTNQTWFKIAKPGVYKGQCAELCGANHADMKAQVTALPVDDYQVWAERQRADIADAKTQLTEQRKAMEAQQN